MGFYHVGYGCMTCIGNSGDVVKEVEEAIKEKDLCVASVLSGNRNFEGRVNPSPRATSWLPLPWSSPSPSQAP